MNEKTLNEQAEARPEEPKGSEQIPAVSGCKGYRFNVNKIFIVELNDVGKLQYKKYYEELLSKHPKLLLDQMNSDEWKNAIYGGYFRGPMHSIMHIFGEITYNGHETPFKNNIIIQDE